MEKIFRIKSELFWVLRSEGVEVYYNNIELNKIINTNKNEEFFDFLEFLVEGKTESEIDNYSNLKNKEKKEILNFLETNKYGLWESPHTHTRTEYFINTFPGNNFEMLENDIELTQILIIGLGTAGSYVLEILTKLGFKNITLIDGDTVEYKNIDSQNYTVNDIGKYKTEVLFQKYKDLAEIKYHTLFIRSFYELSTILEINDFDFIINGADQFSLMQSLLTAKIKGDLGATLIESGYGVLQQTAYMIDNVEKAELIKNQLDSVVLDSKRWIVNNNGSIFNAIFSSFSISKMIFDKVLKLNNSNVVLADLLQNRYFIGSEADKYYYDEYSKSVQKNMQFKHEINNESTRWVPKITTKNALLVSPNYDVKNTLSLYEREFILHKSKNPLFEIAEYKADKILISSTYLYEDNKEKIMQLFLGYIYRTFGEELYERVNNVLLFTLFEDQQKNNIKQSKTVKINQNWLVFNTMYQNELERILGRIHELFHVVYWDVTQNSYEHERFVMENEVKFLEEIKDIDESTIELYKFYLKKQLNLFAKNYTISNYEKAILTNNLSNFQIEFNDLTKNRLDQLVVALNAQIDVNKPFKQLKYLNAFEKNQEYFENAF